jgi:hypothetical protein
MKRFIVTMIDGTEYNIETTSYDAAVDRAVLASLEVIRSWPMLPSEVHKAITPFNIELVES